MIQIPRKHFLKIQIFTCRTNWGLEGLEKGAKLLSTVIAVESLRLFFLLYSFATAPTDPSSNIRARLRTFLGVGGFAGMGKHQTERLYHFQRSGSPSPPSHLSVQVLWQCCSTRGQPHWLADGDAEKYKRDICMGTWTTVYHNKSIGLGKPLCYFVQTFTLTSGTNPDLWPIQVSWPQETYYCSSHWSCLTQI